MKWICIHSGVNMANWLLVIFIILAIVAVFFIIVIVIDGNRFHSVKYQLYSNKIESKHKYVVLSDLHNKSYGKNNEKLIKSIEHEEPEAILIAGDILTSKPGKDFTIAVELIKNLADKYPIYYGMGNHETRLFLYPEVYGDMGKRYEEKINKAQVTFMRNESREAGDCIRITGLDMRREYYKRFKKTPMDRTYMEDTLGTVKPECYEILLAHNPDYFEEYASKCKYELGENESGRKISKIPENSRYIKSEEILYEISGNFKDDSSFLPNESWKLSPMNTIFRLLFFKSANSKKSLSNLPEPNLKSTDW